MAGIRLEKVNKVYPNGFRAVKDTDLEIPDNEFVVLLGPSGCGKTTMLRMIAGLEEITSGSLYIGERLVNQVEAKDRDVAMVFQNYALYPHMTVFDNLAFALKLRKLPKPEITNQVHEVAGMLDIADLLPMRPRQLSGGQMQRVALGRAMVRKPTIFLMDEPLSNLDTQLRVSLRAELIRLHQSLSTTFIYVTHDQTEAMTMGSTIVVMKDGVVQQVGTPTEIYERPGNMFVASFIGSPPMNFLDGRIISHNDELYIQCMDNLILIPRGRFCSDLSRYIERPVVIGIRPEDVIISDGHNEEPGHVFTARLDIAESMGYESHLHLMLAGCSLVVRTRGRVIPQPGDAVGIGFDNSRIHLFSCENHQSIL